MRPGRRPGWPPGSLPSRGAWIEINMMSDVVIGDRVAPLAGSVDRNQPLGQLG